MSSAVGLHRLGSAKCQYHDRDCLWTAHGHSCLVIMAAVTPKSPLREVRSSPRRSWLRDQTTEWSLDELGNDAADGVAGRVRDGLVRDVRRYEAQTAEWQRQVDARGDGEEAEV